MNRFVFAISLVFLFLAGNAQESRYFSPCDIEIDNNKLYVAGKTANEVRLYDLVNPDTYDFLKTEDPPKALEIFGEQLFVVTSFSEGKLLITDKHNFKKIQKVSVGNGACDVKINNTGTKAYVANQFSNDISVVDLNKKKELKRIPVLRQPTQLVISEDEKYLFVANFLTAGRADVDTVAAEVSIIDLESERLIKNIQLANGSNALRGMALSADGNYVFISHNLGRFQVPTTQLEQGWMNTSAMSVINARSLEFVATVLLDEPEYGAAGSWGIDCSPEYILVVHSGTHDFSIINYPAFIKKIATISDKASLSYDLRFLSGLRKRIKVSGNGPRVAKFHEGKVFAANYFSDEVDEIDPTDPVLPNYKRIVLNENLKNDPVRLGEIYFNDATYCFQGWQSCNGCHPGEGRTDGMNWDLLNDGIGNPKNCKSMLGSHETAPAMITGIRPEAETAVRAGFTHIQFVQIDEEHARAVDEYLKALTAVPSPYLVKGKLSNLAENGQKVFEKAGCIHCHYGPWFTDQKQHEMGKQGEFDHQNTWDTPTLVELWRTGPYLHDGRSATMKEVFTREKHGLRKELSEDDVDALVEYILSL